MKKQKKKKQTNKKGFTLIELLAVITIMGILMMVAIPAVSRTIENSRRDTFADVAQNYLNAIRNAVLADEIECIDTTGATYKGVNTFGVGEYYFLLATDASMLTTGLDATAGTQAVTQTGDLMESGGKSSWGNADVAGFVYFKKEQSTTNTNETKTSYKVALADSAKHGIAGAFGGTGAEDQKVTRTQVATSNVTIDLKAIYDGAVTATADDVYFCKYK